MAWSPEWVMCSDVLPQPGHEFSLLLLLLQERQRKTRISKRATFSTAWKQAIERNQRKAPKKPRGREKKTHKKASLGGLRPHF